MDIVALLKSKNMSITDNRIRIIECLSDDHHFHTIAEVAEHLKNINTKSIYNNIKQLVEVGIVDSYSFGGVAKYALNDNLNKEHEALEIHLVHSEDDVRHMAISSDVLKAIENEVEKNGYHVDGIKVFVNVTKK